MNVHSRHTLCAISLNDLRGFVLTEPGEHKVLLCLKPTGHFWVFLLKIQSGGGVGWGISNHSDSQMSAHTWDENIKSFTLCRCVFTLSKELNYLETFLLKKIAELLWYILALRFIVLELSASSVPENRSPHCSRTLLDLQPPHVISSYNVDV